ncbi:MAG: hypothetical protein U0354_05115 [Candidatus Sericytochromatia bacterium]
MKFINFLVLGGMLAFFLISIAFFVKRYLDNKDKISKINREGSNELQRSLEDELRQKKEKELKKLESGDLNTINEVLERIFKSSKLVALIKNRNYKLYNIKNISITVNLSGKDELIDSKKEIVLKTGEVYTQNKHYMAIKKEYSEKVFLSAYRIIEEVFNSVPTIFKVYISLYLTEEESDKQTCVLSFEVNRDQYKITQSDNKSFKDKIDTFSPVYDYDIKNYHFNEIEPVSTPEGEISLEKTMATKASTNTTFYGGSIINDGESINLKKDVSSIDNSKIDSNTKISSLNNSSIMLYKAQLGLDKIINESENNSSIDNNDLSFDSSILKLFKNYGLVNINEEIIDNDFRIIKALKSSENKYYLVGVNTEKKVIKEDDLKSLFFKAIKDTIDRIIFITNSSFALDAVTYANVNSIEIFDEEKMNKINK